MTQFARFLVAVLLAVMAAIALTDRGPGAELAAAVLAVAAITWLTGRALRHVLSSS